MLFKLFSCFIDLNCLSGQPENIKRDREIENLDWIKLKYLRYLF